MRNKYSKEIKNFIAQHVEGISCKELVELVNREMGTDFTYTKMECYKKNNGLTSGLKGGATLKGRSILFSLDVVGFIKNNALGKTNAELTELINKVFKTDYKVKQIKCFKNRNHISSGLTGYFELGKAPKNKGQKMSPGVYEKAKKTMFKKGHEPHNYLPIGSEKRDTKDRFVYVKIAEPSVWKQKHRILWEQHNGEVPAGHHVIFLDGNRENIVIENLALISIAESLILNRKNLRSNDAQLTTTAVAVAKVKAAIYKKSKQKENE